jgi:hypothetical protein
VRVLTGAEDVGEAQRDVVKPVDPHDAHAV